MGSAEAMSIQLSPRAQAEWEEECRQVAAYYRALEEKMSIQRWAAKPDSNRAEIVAALRKAGCVVYDIRRPVDLLVGYQSNWMGGYAPVTMLVEIKREPGKRGGTSHAKHTEAQLAFLKSWNGGPVATVDSPVAALRAIGVMK